MSKYGEVNTETGVLLGAGGRDGDGVGTIPGIVATAAFGIGTDSDFLLSWVRGGVIGLSEIVGSLVSALDIVKFTIPFKIHKQH